MRLRKAFISGAALALAATFGTTGAQAASLLVNGSFEDAANFVPNADDTMSLGAGATAMTGWTVVGDSLAWIGAGNPFGLSASSGSYFLDLTDYPVGAPFGGVTQTINTVLGQNYVLEFDLGSSRNYGLPDSLTATAGASSQTFTSSLTGPDNWEHFSMNFVGLGGPTAITLTGDTGYAYIGLDSVSVTGPTASDVPEPGTWALMLAGVAGLGAALRRRRILAIA